MARFAQVAQLVEHATENRSVGGSIPPLGTIPPIVHRPVATTLTRPVSRVFSGPRLVATGLLGR